MRLKYVFILLLISSTIFVQEKDPTLNNWIASAVVGFNISQLALSNWSQGGENSLTWSLA